MDMWFVNVKFFIKSLSCVNEKIKSLSYEFNWLVRGCYRNVTRGVYSPGKKDWIPTFVGMTDPHDQTELVIPAEAGIQYCRLGALYACPFYTKPLVAFNTRDNYIQFNWNKFHMEVTR